MSVPEAPSPLDAARKLVPQIRSCAEQTDADASATSIFQRGGLSTVDDVDTPVGRLASSRLSRAAGESS